MNDYWKLPKEVRKSVTKKCEQLTKKVRDSQTKINQLTNQLVSARYDMERAKDELTALCQEYNITTNETKSAL